ncbi:MAG: FAD-dependent oxidoreductase [Proteobacteria bacterium]|nr:FAD-dependent oxidoreductase [Pseudomonadota bacterium]
MKPLIIVGTGLAGYNLAKEFRKWDTTTPLILITQDNGHFYSKPQISTALANAKAPTQLIITDVNTMALQLNAKILTHTQVTAIDCDAMTIYIENETNTQEIVYRDLVLAMGASPKPFPTLNALATNNRHFRINNLQDYSNFIDNIDNLDNLALIGSGLVGCEFAHDFRKRINTLHVITPDPHPLYRLVPACIGEALQHTLEKMGIHFHTSTLLCHVDAQTSLTLSLTGAKEIKTDGILTAIGLHPNTLLAKQASIHVKQGIVVDDYLQTNQSHIYAFGDCAQIQGICRQYVAPLLQCARALAQTLCGKKTAITFVPSPIMLKVSAYPVVVNPPPLADGQWEYDIQSDGIKALFKDPEGSLLGYALSGSQIVHRQECLKALSEKELIS